ncbi:hypothetical protein ZWY2020_037813 [Hordeum vulgare]|nr:hypothetical protein ZWY2020_037813 [Hordeum vulgare]
MEVEVKLDDAAKTAAPIPRLLRTDAQRNAFFDAPARPIAAATHIVQPERGDTTLLVSCFDKITRWCAVGIQGAQLSHILEPLYLSTITIGQSPNGASEGFCIENNVVKVLGARLSCLSKKFPEPFKWNKTYIIHVTCWWNFIYLQPLFFEAPIPPKQFQQTSGDIPPLTCGYSICWNKSGLHEVILGSTGRKQGTSSKAASLPSTESLLCKIRLAEAFISLEHPLVTKFSHEKIAYRAIKDMACEYQQMLELLRKPHFLADGVLSEELLIRLQFHGDDQILSLYAAS